MITPTVAKIYAAWERAGRSETPRTYLGCSELGHECEMYLWLKFRGTITESFPGRMYRLFDRGQREEAVFIQDLQRIGCEVKSHDTNGNQFAVSAFGGHLAGHLDGLALGVPEAPKTRHITEFKTHNEASFKKLLKEGVRSAKPMHYAQMQLYMGLSEADRALYLAVNKNADDLYSERVKFDKGDFDVLMAKAKRIITTSEPQRCASRIDDFRCKGCPAHSLCWHTTNTIIDATVRQSCLTCCFSTPIIDSEGKAWKCERGHSCSTKKDTCADYLVLPVFVNADIVEGFENSITYQKDDVKFTIGNGYFSADELKKLTIAEVEGAKFVKSKIPNATVQASNSLIQKYANHETYFTGTVEELRGWLKASAWQDWSRPDASETIGGTKYFEYRKSETLVIVDEDNDKSEVRSSSVPF